MASAIQRLEVVNASAATMAVTATTPQILRINRHTLRQETEAAMRNLQKQVAQALAKWDHPHPCLAIEALTGPREVWTIAGFQSSIEQKAIAEKLDDNEVLRSALERIEAQVRVLTGDPATLVAQYRPSTRRGRSWLMGRGHYMVISVSNGPADLDGACYETASGERYHIIATRTRKDADCRAHLAGSKANVFAIRPTWGMPSRDWVDADPEFWNASPVAKQGPRPTSQFRKFTSSRW